MEVPQQLSRYWMDGDLRCRAVAHRTGTRCDDIEEETTLTVCSEDGGSFQETTRGYLPDGSTQQGHG